ncbi:hypothetical protein GALMADRAFT_148900 [Galerina marginata CBS 339.88]|uniref:RNase H type-1 domain-containing protein n=1 Tax=Galerina marginata (strain CBS 339.88) TaxID=685588 RepID=A0A067S5M6_GALM3|nr:hypothetical protein GALMADRAFT_148900 [Galerina marginata CBS 339.88]
MAGYALERTLVFTLTPLPRNTPSDGLGVFFSQGIEVNRFRWLVGRTTAPDAEQSAICRAIEGAVKHPCRHIAIFTDSIASAKRALDTSLHLSQSHSLRACKVLETWLEDDPLRWISFHYVPTKLKWRYQHMAHDYAATAYHRPVDFGSWVTFDRLRSESDSRIALRWAQSVANRPQHLGRDFLQLTTLGKKPKPILPSTRKGGPYIRESGADAASFACMCRCILNHAPIGSYYDRFNIDEPHGCPQCGAPRETRSHILSYCPKYEQNSPTDRLHGLLMFLLDNPQAFSFTRQAAAPQGIGPEPIRFFRILPTASFVRQAFARGDGPPNRQVPRERRPPSLRQYHLRANPKAAQRSPGSRSCCTLSAFQTRHPLPSPNPTQEPSTTHALTTQNPYQPLKEAERGDEAPNRSYEDNRPSQKCR